MEVCFPEKKIPISIFLHLKSTSKLVFSYKTLSINFHFFSKVFPTGNNQVQTSLAVHNLTWNLSVLSLCKPMAEELKVFHWQKKKKATFLFLFGSSTLKSTIYILLEYILLETLNTIVNNP